MKYAGIGSRRTPPEILEQMEALASQLAAAGFVLRSGGAEGADSAFERGCDAVKGPKEIFLPWKGFNGRKESVSLPNEKAISLASQIHPAWNKCSPGAWKLHARNCQQVLGENLDDPSDFIICWSPGNGGTEQALRVAKIHNIPVFNLIDPEAKHRLQNYLLEHAEKENENPALRPS